MARRLSSPVLVGRDDELARCRALMDAAASGEGATLLITGEAGIGKSRFAAELVAEARRRDWTVLSGACDEFSNDARPFGALREMLTGIEAAIQRDSLTEFDSPAWGALSRLGNADISAGPQSASVPHLFADLLLRLSAQRPTLVVIDDLHWADESTRTVLLTVSRALAESPAVVAACYRANEIGRGHPLRQVLATVHRNARPEVIELQPLDHEGVARLAASMGLAEMPDVDALLEQSGGIPFLAEELLPHSGPNVPAGIANVVVARIDALGPDVAALAEAAALDTAVPLPVLESVAGLDGSRARAALDALVETGVFAAAGAEVTFRHAIGREAVAERILPGRRLELHERLARAFEATSPPDIARAARHWNETGDRANTLRTSVRAAMQAAATGAHAEAADLFERALDLWDSVPDGARPARARGVVVKHAAISMSLAWQFERCAPLVLAQLNRDEPSTAMQRADLWLSAGWATMGYPPQTPPPYPPAWAIRNACSSLDLALERESEVDLAVGILAMMDVLGLEDDLRELASRVNDVLPTARSEENRAALEALSDAIRVILMESPPEVPGSVPAWAALNRQARIIERFMIAGHLEEGIPFASSHLEALAAGGRYPLSGPFTEGMLARADASLGHWPPAMNRLVRLQQSLPEVAELWVDVLVWGWGPLLARTGGAPLAAKWALLAAKRVEPRGRSQLAAGLAMTRVEVARIVADVAASRSAVRNGFETTGPSSLWTAEMGEAVAYAIGIEADLPTRDTHAEAVSIADGWLQKLEACIDATPFRAECFDLAMFIEQARMERERLLGNDKSDAWAHLAARWEALPRPYHAAYAHFRAASALLTGGAAAGAEARRAATDHIDASLAICGQLGAVVLAEEVERLRSAAGIRAAKRQAPEPGRNAASNGHGLTARETEVLALLVRGQTNGQIARQLGIETRTASVHVSNIIHKLGAANRVDAAVKAGDLGLLKG